MSAWGKSWGAAWSYGWGVVTRRLGVQRSPQALFIRQVDTDVFICKAETDITL